MKKFIVITLLLSILLLAGCGGGTEPANIAMEDLLEDIKAYIIEENGYTEEDLAHEELPGYGIIDLKGEDGQWALEVENDDIVEGFVIKAGMLNADQIIVLKAASGKAEAIKDVLEAQKASQVELWEGYAPEQAVKVNATIIAVQGDYVIYITYPDAEGIEEVINSAM